jgi:Dolichyl-phosphate-mannose-protein mannosyltransferase
VSASVQSKRLAALTSRLSSPYVIVGTALALRVALLFSFEGTVQDGTSRVGTAAGWLFHGTSVFGRTFWPEGNYVLPAIALLVSNEPYWSVRILYVLVGVTTVWLSYALGREVFGRAAGAVAGWAVALMPYHLVASTDVAMSETPYVSLILVTLLMLVRYAATPGPWLAVAAGASLTLAITFRFDGVVWGLPLALAVVVVGFRRHLPPLRIGRDLLLFGLCSLAYPMALFLRWRELYPDPFHILAVSKTNTLQFFVNGRHPRWPVALYQSYAILFWPGSTLVLLSPVLAFLGWVGVASSLRQQQLRPLPVSLGILAVCTWLGYATYQHDILAQWRFGLVIAVCLAIFAAPGAAALVRRWPRLTYGHIAVAVVVAAIGSVAVIVYGAFTPAGVLARQIGMLSPIKPDQFASRHLINWIENDVAPGERVLLTPHTLEQPYLDMHRAGLERAGKLIVQSYYLPGSDIVVYTKSALIGQLLKKLSEAHYVVTSTSSRELGLQDGLTRELITPIPGTHGNYVWNGVTLRLEQRFGSNVVWSVVGSIHGPQAL